MSTASGDRASQSTSEAVGLRRWLAVVFCGIFAVWLLTLAVPRTGAAWYGMGADEDFRTLALGRAPTNDRFDAAVSSLSQAIDWVPSGDRFYRLASFEWERYRRLPLTDPVRIEWLARAARDLKQGLLANPADGRASAMLAVVLTQQGAPARQVAAALLHSMDMTPNLRELWLWRMTYLFAAWFALTPGEAAAVHSQLRTIWKSDQQLRYLLLQAAAASGRLDEVAAALANEPAGLTEFERLKLLSPANR